MRRLTIALALLLILPRFCLADDVGRPGEIFETLDRNGDGILVADEIDKAQQKAFERLLRVGDADEDGRLTKDEYAKGLKPDAPVQIAPGGEGDPGPRRDGQQRLDMDRLFQMSDRDGDGRIALTDLPEAMRPRLKPLFDRLGREQITREDLERFGRGQGEMMQRFAGERPQMALVRLLDADADGQLNRAEIARLPEKFADLDRDGDGQLSVGELIGFAGGPAGGRDMRRPDDANGRTTPRPRRPEGADSDASKEQDRLKSRESDQVLKANDADGDGFLSRDECPERLAGLFDRIDADGNGRLSSDELRRARERRGRDSDAR